MTDKNFPEDTGTGLSNTSDGDWLDAANLAALGHNENYTDLVLTGLNFTPDWSNDQLTVSSGQARIKATSISTVDRGSDTVNWPAVTFTVRTDEKTVDLNPDAYHEVYLTTTLQSVGDDVEIDVRTDGSVPNGPTLNIGSIDTGTQDFDDTVNRLADIEVGDLTAHGSLTGVASDDHDNSQHSTNYAAQTDLDSHADASTGVHGVSGSDIESVDGAQSKVDSHASDTSDVHGVGSSSVASAQDISDHADISDAHHVKYSDSDAVSAINAESVLDVGISGDADTLDGKHLADIQFSDTSMTRYADSEAVSAVNAETTLDVDITGDADTLDGVQLSDIQFSDTSMSRYTDSEAVSAVNNETELSVDISGDADTLDGVDLADIQFSDTSMSRYTDSEAVGAVNNETELDVDISGDADTLDGFDWNDITGDKRYHTFGSGSETEYHKIVTLKDKSEGTNGGGAMRATMEFTEGRGDQPVRTRELIVFAKGSSFNAEFIDNGASYGKEHDFVITEDPGDGSDTDHQYHVYVRTDTWAAGGVEVVPSQWFGQHDYQSGLSETDLIGNIVYDTANQDPNRMIRVGRVDAYDDLNFYNSRITGLTGIVLDYDDDDGETRIIGPTNRSVGLRLKNNGTDDAFTFYTDASNSGNVGETETFQIHSDRVNSHVNLQETGNRVATRQWTNDNADVPNADYADNADQLDGVHLGDISFSDTAMNRYSDTEAVNAVNSETELSVDISGDADTVDGSHAADFADASHTSDTSNPHNVDNNDVGVTSSTNSNGNYEITIDGDTYEFIPE